MILRERSGCWSNESVIVTSHPGLDQAAGGFGWRHLVKLVVRVGVARVAGSLKWVCESGP